MGNEEQQLPNEPSEDNAEASDTRDTLVSPRSGRTIKKIRNEVNNGLLMPGSPPTIVTMDQLTEAANAFYNMSLAHEITVDSHFMLGKYNPPEKSLEHCVKETMHRAFWDIIRSSLEADPPNYEPALGLLGEVKQSLSGLILPNQKTLEKLLDNCLDLDVARAQLEETGRLSLETYAEQVIGIMKQFCAPFRDDAVAALEAITDPVEAFREAFILLDKMHMDLANFTIMQMRPYIRKQAAQYERTKFATFLATQKKIGIDGLLRTRRWIQEAHQHITAQQQKETATPETGTEILNSTAQAECAQNPTTQPASSTAAIPKPIEPTPSNILLEAYLSLLTWPTGVDWPETMVMDQQRLTDIGLQLSKIVTLTSLVLVVCNCVVHKANHLFPVPVAHSVQTRVLLDLKRAVFRGASSLLDSASLVNLSEKANDVADHLLSVVEHWYNSVYSVCQNPSNVSKEGEDIVGVAKSATPPKTLPEVVRRETETQTIVILKCQHPVYRLMQSRAMNFLRSALSSYPPESLPLPPGFGILAEMTKSTGTSSAIPSTSSTNCLGSSPCLPTMTSGIRRVRVPDPQDLEDKEEPTLGEQNSSEGQPSALSTSNLSLTDVAGRLMPLLAHNRHVFGAQYAEIIQSLLFPQTASTSVENSPDKGNNSADDNESTFIMSN